MKKQLLTIAILLSATFAKAQINLDSNLVLYLPFIGNANDSSGNNNNGTVYGATLTTDKAGNLNSAYFFDGLSNYIEVPDNPTLTPTLYTISALIKPQGFYTGTCQGNVILWKGLDQIAGHYGLIFSDLAYDNDCNALDTLHENFYNDQGFVNGNVADTPFVQTDTWFCLLSTFDGDSVRMYVNGTLTYTAFHTQIGVNSSSLSIGANLWFAGYEYWYTGVMDEIRIYNRVLNNSEINALCGLNSGIAEENNYTPFQMNNYSTNGIYNLHFNKQLQSLNLSVYNSLGQQLYFEKLQNVISGSEKIINLPSLSSGVYFLKLVADGMQTSMKIIKQ